MNLIFSADRSWGIGRDNRLLFRVPGDMRFFRETTLGKAVVMGRKTLDSLPGGRPLPDRDNLVVTRDPAFRREGIAACRSLEELFQALRAYREEDIFVIGGEQLYRQLAPYSGKALVTRWEADAGADAFAPNLDADTGWRLVHASEPVTEQNITYRFCTYVQSQPIPWRTKEAPYAENRLLV